MKRIAPMILTAAFGMAVVLIARADQTTPCGKSSASASSATAKVGCCSKTKSAIATVSATESGCGVKSSFERAMKLLPRMAYKIGGKTTACPMSAQAQANESGESIVYVVNGEETACKKTAMNKLADAITADVDQLAHVVVVVDDEVISCRKTAAKVAAEKNVTPRYMVAGVEFDCPKKAELVAARVASKIKEMRSGDASGDKSAAKATTASAKDEGCCTGGNRKSDCSKTDCDGQCDGKCGGKCDGKCADKDCPGCSKCDSAKAKVDDKTAVTASAKTDGCCKSAAKVAAGKGCGSKGGCAKKAAAAASDDPPCGSKESGGAQVASADTGCSKSKGASTGAVVAKVDESEETPALSRAKRMIRDIVQYVVQESERTSETS